MTQRSRNNSNLAPFSLQSLHCAPVLLPAPDTALYGALRQWFQRLRIAPTIVGEFDDSALMKVFGQAGVGVFCAPSVIEREVREQYDVEAIGRTKEIRERFYLISTERRLGNPAVVAVSRAAHQIVFRQDYGDSSPSAPSRTSS